jgi:hypothetical protein
MVFSAVLCTETNTLCSFPYITFILNLVQAAKALLFYCGRLIVHKQLVKVRSSLKNSTQQQRNRHNTY